MNWISFVSGIIAFEFGLLVFMCVLAVGLNLIGWFPDGLD